MLAGAVSAEDRQGAAAAAARIFQKSRLNETIAVPWALATGQDAQYLPDIKQSFAER